MTGGDCVPGVARGTSCKLRQYSQEGTAGKVGLGARLTRTAFPTGRAVCAKAWRWNRAGKLQEHQRGQYGWNDPGRLAGQRQR